EQTKGGDFEDIDFHNFKAVDYPRKMSWEKTKPGVFGRVAIGNPILTNQKTDEDGNDVTLEAGWIVVVKSMKFKLV
ncbi:hypothetical protein EJ07DRAFT_93277, partial [Lizonia empirigonia]